MSKQALIAKAALAAGTSAWNYMARKRKSASRTATRKPRGRGRGARRSVARLRYKRKSATKKSQQVGEWDYSKRNATFGKRPRHDLRYVNRVLSAASERIQFYATQMSQFGGVNGANWLMNRQTALGSLLFTPVKLFDVTSCNNVVSGAISVGPCAQDLLFTNETNTAAVQWINYPSQNWSLQTGPESNAAFDSYPNEKSYLEWVNARFMFYAPTAIPTRIQIDLVRFKDDRLVPSAPIGAGAVGYGGVAAASSDAFTTGFWQYMSKKYMWNQIEPMDNTYRKYYKILKSMTLYMDPKESTDPSNTRYREVNFFANLNRQLSYRWQDTDRVSMAATDTQVVVDNDNNVQVHPRYRTFLMVRAVSQRTVAAAPAAASHPSFDWFIRTRHTVLN